MTKNFTRMKVNNGLVQKLLESPWWKKIRPELCSDKNINIQIRGNYLNIYYKMNNLLKMEMDPKSGKIKYTLHYKFVPLIDKKLKAVKTTNKKGLDNYVELTLNDDHLDIPKTLENYEWSVVTGDIFNSDNLVILKKQIDAHVNEEKDHQSKFIYNNRDTIIDAEVAFNDIEQKGLSNEEATKEKNRTRIDILNYDKNKNKIIAIELKMVLDKRLYNGEIKDQLKSYTSFLTRKERDIKEAYEDAKRVKMELGLLPPNSKLRDIDFRHIAIEKKPLLVVVCYEKVLIEAFRKTICDAVKDCAFGAFFFRKVGDLNIPVKKDENKIIF